MINGLKKEIRCRLRGASELIRFADDFIVVFEEEHDAKRVEEVLHKRLGKYGLSINAEKTRIVAFSRPRDEDDKPDTFSFLGFTHYWGKSRKGNWIVKRKTASKKLRAAVRRVFAYCKENRHRPVSEQWEKLSRKIKGHCGYYGITCNSRSLEIYRQLVQRSWKYWLNRRSRNKDMPWERFRKLLKRYPLPYVRIVHSYLANA
ncbi:MAG: reverse transcriptase domain-containing protein [Desulfomonilaceae bacterium]